MLFDLSRQMKANTRMLHADGKSVPSEASARQGWMALLARAPLSLLETAVGPYAGPAPHWLRRPETGLVMLPARIGGSGERFNLGEATVTRCVLRPDPAVVRCAATGVAYVLGRSHRHATLAATADALLQDPECPQGRTLAADLLPRIAEGLAQQQRCLREKAQATRVEFFTLARESADGAQAEEQA